MSLTKQSNEVEKLLLENMTTALILIDRDFKVKYANPAAENLLEMSKGRVAEYPVELIFGGDKESIDALKQCFDKGHPYTRREAQLSIIGNGHRFVDYTVSPMGGQQPCQEILVEFQILDRLKRITKEEAIVSSYQATKALLRGVAHEVKNPLGGIRGAAQLLDKELPNEDLKDYTRVIIDEADRLRNLVDRMLGPRKLPQPRDVNIHEVLERIKSLADVETNHSIRINRDYDTSIPHLQADFDQLVQSLLNIVRNSIQALQENKSDVEPEITLKTRVVRQFTLGIQRYRLVLQINIIDNGPGIPAELTESLFYPMVSGRPTGTGLGLSIAQSIIQQHHGIIECESQPGETVFSIYLPLEKEQ